MTVKARVFFKRGNWDRGIYEFIQLPTKGDQFTLKQNGGAINPDGSEDLSEVLYVEHFPIALDGATTEGQEPSATLIVEWITGLSG